MDTCGYLLHALSSRLSHQSEWVGERAVVDVSGGNDVANSFATSVGAKALTLKQTIIIASICEFSGAMLMGSHVTKTIKGGIVEESYFIDSPVLLMYDYGCVWLCILAGGLNAVVSSRFQHPYLYWWNVGNGICEQRVPRCPVEVCNQRHFILVLYACHRGLHFVFVLFLRACVYSEEREIV